MTDELMEMIKERASKRPVPDFESEMKAVNMCLDGLNNADKMQDIEMSLDAIRNALNEADEEKEKNDEYQRAILKVLWDADVLSRLTGYQTALSEMLENESEYTDKEWKDAYLDAMCFCEIAMMANEGACNVRDKYYACQVMHYIETKHPECVPTDDEKRSFRRCRAILRNIF